MDPVSHSLIGAAVGRSFGLRRAQILALAVLAELPDADIVFSLMGIEIPAFYHRSWTHSILGCLVLGASAWPLLGSRVFGSVRPPLAAPILAAVSHAFGDLITSYGTPLLWPFRTGTLSLDWIGNLSWIPPLLLGGGLALSGIARVKRGVLIATWAAFFLFVGGSALLHRQALAMAPDLGDTDAVPHLIRPGRWRVIIRDEVGGVYRLYEARPWEGKLDRGATYPLPEESSWVQESRSLPRVQLFLKHNRWPLARVERGRGGGVEVIWGNLLFFRQGEVHGRLVVSYDGLGELAGITRNGEPWAS